MRKDDKEILVCACHSVEHQVVISYDEEDNQAYISIHLVPLYSFWKRFVHGIKYIFGYRCKYGDFDEFLFKEEHAEKLQELVEKLKNNNK